METTVFLTDETFNKREKTFGLGLQRNWPLSQSRRPLFLVPKRLLLGCAPGPLLSSYNVWQHSWITLTVVNGAGQTGFSPLKNIIPTFLLMTEQMALSSCSFTPTTYLFGHIVLDAQCDPENKKFSHLHQSG